MGDNADGEDAGASFLDKLWVETRTALDRLSAAAVSYNTTCPHFPESADNVPVFLLHVMFQVTCMFLRLAEGTPSPALRDQIETLRNLLRHANKRWRLAGE